MKTDIKIKYSDTFGTTHSRDYYKGKSFHYAGEWVSGAHYFSDDYNVDFVSKDNCLLACSKSHFSTIDNEPKDYIYNSEGVIVGISSRYWDFVLSGSKGTAPRIKIEDNSFWVSYDDGQTWEKMDDLTFANWGLETDDSVELSISNVSKTLLTHVNAITDSEIDTILSKFNIVHNSE